jgi:hypothetical protein
MWRMYELLYVYFIVLELHDGSLILVDITVVGSTEECDNHREFLLVTPPMHLISLQLGFMCSND